MSVNRGALTGVMSVNRGALTGVMSVNRGALTGVMSLNRGALTGVMSVNRGALTGVMSVNDKRGACPVDADVLSGVFIANAEAVRAQDAAMAIRLNFMLWTP